MTIHTATPTSHTATPTRTKTAAAQTVKQGRKVLCLLKPISQPSSLLIEIMAALSVAYLLSALFYFANWFKAFQKETNLSPQEKAISIKVLIVASVLWPIAVPISHLEKCFKDAASHPSA